MIRSLKNEKNYAAATFFWVLGLGLMLFLPFVIFDRGIFVYYGDYNAQQIPFYQMAHDAVRAGNIGWSWTTDLGANFIGSYSFYLLGSPFFWLTLPFPSAWVPYMMAPLMVLKMACAATAAYAYASRFLHTSTAVSAGVLYAFCGFSIFNIFFNHFHEAMIWFPLMLLGLEQYMTEGKRGLFAVSVFISALCNYYFFIGQALFVMIYWLVRAGSAGEWQHIRRRFLGTWLQALIGVAAAAVLLLPSYLAVTQNGRTEQVLQGWGLLIYSTNQRPLDILRSFIFPPEPVARLNFLPDANNKWASMSMWIPVFGCTGAIAYFQSRRHTDWLRRLMVISVICAFVPVFNAFFQLFNQMYYARWFYMPVLLFILATLKCFDEEQPVEWRRAIGWSAGLTTAFAVLIGLVPAKWENIGKAWRKNAGFGAVKAIWESLGLEKYRDWFWLYVGIAFLCLALTGWLAHKNKSDRQGFAFRCFAVVSMASLLFGWGYITIGKTVSNYPSTYVTEKLIGNGNFDLPESDVFCRTDMNAAMDNQGMYWQMPCIQAFHSIVPGSVMDFYTSVGVSRSVGSRPGTDAYALRGLLSVRWDFDYAQKEGDVKLHNRSDSSVFMDEDGNTKMPGWTFYNEQNGFNIYENDNFVPMGFFYDSYITHTDYENLDEESRRLVLLKALVIEDADAETCPLPHADTDMFEYTEEAYAADCAARAATAASTFATDRTGFTATVHSDEDNLVFFSVPYESGWSAAVDGKETEIYKVNVGFMAVLCPAGKTVTVRFDYETPGLRIGAMISAVGLFALLLYLLCASILNHRIRKQRAQNDTASPVVPVTPITPETPVAPETPVTPTAPETPIKPAESAIPKAPDDFNLYEIYQPDPADKE